MRPTTHRDLPKLQIICALFPESVGEDLYLARQIKESIEASLPQPATDDPQAFLRSAQKLARSEAQPAAADDQIQLVAVPASHSFSDLTLRSLLLDSLKKANPHTTPLIVLIGLKEAICPPGKRWTDARATQYQEAIGFARNFCRSRIRPSCSLSLIIF